MRLNLLSFHVLGNHSPNLVQISAVVAENEHADSRMDKHDEFVVPPLFPIMQKRTIKELQLL